ncbi:hypothetical protein K8F61_17065 [Microbacterium resistens]|uniref:GH18 domain-containing protein n=1 Tax=Microbacterium resistens TaxID=156977 RepID=A0ABY3RTM3_9MICO|nr:glycosyl hydrolase family 18 protein [Microbacterium resistens]UGS26315.1 hypothetical protein K8F61_17065 [Microbacterium resistens]
MRVWVWVGHMWTDRVRLALEHYGDRITDVSIFGWHVDAAGELTQTFNADVLLPYAERWPHLRFWLAFRNDGDPDIAAALLASPQARTRLLDDLGAALTARPWLAGIDIDLERVGGAENAEPAENLFRQIAALAHSRGLECSAALPPLTASGSVGGEDWARYSVLGGILDHAAIMSYDFAWAGSAPGPVSPGFWMREVYNWAVSQIPPKKLMMGLPLYSYFWAIHNYPAALGADYRGESGTYYAAWQHFTGYRAWDGTDANPAGSGTHHRIGWLAFRDGDSRSAWGLQDVYDWRYAPDWDQGSAAGITADEWEGRAYTVRYGLPSGDPLWSVADNSAPGAGASYTLTPRRVRAATGELVAPKVGYTLTAELLKRPPVAATIIDDNAGTQQQLDNVYDVASGAWERWTTGRYHQYRGAGQLNLAHDFDGAVYLQVRGQFAADGWAGVTVRGLTAEVNPAGAVRLRSGSTVLASGRVAPRPVGAPAGDGQFVLGLRVREGSARVYFGLSEARGLPLVLTAAAAPSSPTVGIVADAAFWVDHVYCGDGWWYQPREAVQVQIGTETRALGRFPRTGVTWDGQNRFRPNADIDEWETRTDGPSLDWTYDHWIDAPLSTDTPATIRVQALDHDVWVGRVLAVDRDGASIVFWSDAETVVHWRDRARLDWGLSGIAMWTLGQEDIRTWERLAAGELPPDTKITNG